MLDWLAGIVGEEAAPIASYALILILILIAFFGVRSIMRRMRDGTYVNGGHSRQQRLAIMDATPVDNRRRLVLVRRDNVEHLVLIGGMNDLVIEQDIQLQNDKIEQGENSTPVLKTIPEKSNPVAEQNPIPPAKTESAPEQSKVAPQPIIEEPDPATKPAPVPRPDPQHLAPRVAAASTASVVAVAVKSPSMAAVPETESAEVSAEVRDKPVLREEPVLRADRNVPETSSTLSEENFEPVAPVEPQLVSEPRLEPELETRIDEFRPINEVVPAVETTTAKEVQPEEDEVQPEAEEVDLEDEMEQLLNKLTSSTRK